MTERTPDETLVAAFGRGDDSAFDALVTRYSAQISALANRLLGWSGDVEDVTQEVFLAVYMNLKRFRGKCSLRTWLFTITINKCRAHRRKQMVRQKLLAGFSRHRKMDSRPAGDNGELMEAISRALERLPARYREPVVLYYLEELSIDQICQVLNLKSNAVHVRLNRARHRLKECLGRWESKS